MKQRLISQSQLDQARAARNASAASAREAEAALAELLNGTRIEQVDQARAAVAAAESARTRAGNHRRAAGRAATRAGVVDALPYKAGERPPQGRARCRAARRYAAFARVYVPEPRRARVKPRVAAQIHVDGVEQPLKGSCDGWRATRHSRLTSRSRSATAAGSRSSRKSRSRTPRVRDLPAGVPVEVQMLLGGSATGHGGRSSERDRG